MNRVAAAYLRPNNRTVGLFLPTDHPQRVAIPAAATAEALVKEYKGKEALAAGEFFEPTPEAIEQRVRRSQVPAGLKLALLSKKTRGEAVAISLNLRYGNEESLKGHTSATQFLAPLLERGVGRAVVP